MKKETQMNDIINDSPQNNIDALFGIAREIIEKARKNVHRAVNMAMVEAYWHIGRMIVEEEQNCKERADYGKFLIRNLSDKLTKEFGKGFSSQNLWNMRLFFQKFSALRRELKIDDSSDILSALRRELSWTHYKNLLRVGKPMACVWYMHEAADQNWSTRALERQINSLYYERLLLSRDKQSVMEEAQGKTETLKPLPRDYLKDPYVLEFLNLKDRSNYRESELEQAIINNIQSFLLELGKGFAFVARQKRITTETKSFYIDLVFYNYILKCFILIDLKTCELTHQDVGQMDMYVRMFDDLEIGQDDNPSVGLILCAEKDRTIVKYSVLNENKQLFASKYMMYLPTEAELVKELEREKHLIEMALEEG